MKTLSAKAVPFVDIPAQHRPIKQELLLAVEQVIDHGQFILGPEVRTLETEWARIAGTSESVSVANGTMALLLTLKALGISEGDEVIAPANSFVASISCIALIGAKPVLVDVADDFNLDPERVRDAITPNTKAIIAVHLTGRPADMKTLGEIASEFGVHLIEDAAQAAGASSDGKPVGGFGIAGCFSLHPLKTAGGCGDGGIITTDNSALADRLRLLRNHGITQRQEDCQLFGFNARLDTIQAAMALVKLRHLKPSNETRREHADHYRKRLSHLVRIPEDRPKDHSVYHTFPVEASDRDELARFLDLLDIGSAVHYRIPLHLLVACRNLGYSQGDFPFAERQANRTISLPVHQELTADQIESVCDAIESFYSQ